ncbi:MAG: riboflavin synthase [archaeon]|nr:riboflavin synthase [archaeon]
MIQKSQKTKIAVVDTMFARGDMGKVAIETIEKTARDNEWQVKVVRRTVPGIKDIPVAMLNLLEQGCFAGIALGMPGSAPIDKQCSHEASMAIQQAQLMSKKTVLEVFVHEDEGKNDQDLANVMRNRAQKHAQNLMWLLFAPEELQKRAGSGERQGRDNAKKLEL